jgi:hypothetical protein
MDGAATEQWLLGSVSVGKTPRRDWRRNLTECLTLNGILFRPADAKGNELAPTVNACPREPRPLRDYRVRDERDRNVRMAHGLGGGA